MEKGSYEKRIYIVGAGFAGQAIAAEIRSKGHLGQIAAFLDDDPDKRGTSVKGIPVLGPIDSAARLIKIDPTDEVIIAAPSASIEQLRRIYGILTSVRFPKIRILPNISQIIDEDPHFIQAREIDPQDLLRRDPVVISLKESLAYLRKKRVLVTGAGGSIGSELSRQLLSGGVSRLYLFGHGENNIYEIERELRLLQEEGVGEKTTIVPVLGELQDPEFIDFILARLKADVVFHCAAHKHVPLCEKNSVEAVKNNVFGTLNIVRSAVKNGVKRFVLISTDKAVTPVSVYGVTKLIAEEIVLKYGAPNRAFMVVRFGNVLGSRGSIMPLFMKQIQKGGPVTITDPNATRYFMTIPEASSLVLRTGGVGENRHQYLLDMGKPVRIQDIAEQMIAFFGYRPYIDIPILISGLRDGEKVEEALFSDDEVPCKTEYERILHIERSREPLPDLDGLLENLKPFCYFDPKRPEAFRNKLDLKKVLSMSIPTLRVPEDESEY